MKKQEKKSENQAAKHTTNMNVSASCESLESKQVSLIDTGNMLTRVARITRGNKVSYNIAIGSMMLLAREEEFEREEDAKSLTEETNLIERIIAVVINSLTKTNEK